MQIAKMFASLGFKVDTAGLVVFKKAIASARHELTNLNQGAKKSTNQLRSLRREVDKLSGAMGKIKNAGGNRNVGGSYRNLAGDVHKVRNALDGIATNQPRTTRALGKINAAVIAGTPHWDAYRRSIVQTRQTLRNLNGDLNRLRANARIDVRIRNHGGAGGQGGGNGGSGGAGGLGGLGAGLGMRGFLGNMIPTMALGSVGAGVGYGGVAMVKAAREQTSMESMILMISKSAEEYKNTIDYVNDESRRLGLNAAELGKSYAQISMSASNMSGKDKKEMFTGFSEFMMAMGTNDDDQKGIFRAFNQMFSNNRILQEEINQLSDRGIPATLIYDSAMKAYGLDNVTQVKKLQEAGKLDPEVVLKLMSSMLQEKAHSSGAFDKMQQSSMFKQNQFMSEMRLNSKAIMDGGLDVLLGKIFSQLTEIVIQVGLIAKGIGYISEKINIMKKGLDSISGGFGGEILIALSLMIFRFKVITKAFNRWTFGVRNGGRATVALAGFLKDVLGKTVVNLIKRFGGWLAVLYAVSKALIYLGKQVEQRDLGNWTIFDTISLRIEHTLVKVRGLIEELKWLQTYLTSGAVFDDNLSGIKEGVSSRAKSDFSSLMQSPLKMGVTQILRGKAAYDGVVDKILNKDSDVMSAISETTSSAAKPSLDGTTINIYSNKTGELVETHKVPATYGQ